MGLSGAEITYKDDIPSLFDKLATDTVIDDSFIDGRLKGEVKIL